MFISTASSSSSGIDTGDIANSLRFRSAASAYLSRTFGSTGNRKTFTLSGWLKRGSITSAGDQIIFGQRGSWADGTGCCLIISTSWPDALTFYHAGPSKYTNAFFRDPSSHLHFVLAVDTTQAIEANRLKIYVNGVNLALTTPGGALNQNTDLLINQNVAHSIGANTSGTYPLDGYLSRVCFVDGQALTPSSFGYLNTEINEWVSKTQSEVKAVVDAGGANSFMLDFDNATSLTTLGYDKSSKGNNWTLNNHSLTAGVTYDHMLDVPGNSYATLNPVYRGTQTSASVYGTLSAGNLRHSYTDTADCWTVGSIGASSGKYYWEVIIVAGGGSSSYQSGVGVAEEGFTHANDTAGVASTEYVFNCYSTQKFNNNTASSYGDGTALVNNDVVGVALDCDNGAIYFRKNNGAWYNSGDPTSGATRTGAAFTWTGASKTMYPVSSPQGGSVPILENNFGQRPFAYTPPTGFLALCQANLPTPAILNPKEHFDVVTRSGSNSPVSISSLMFPPDLIDTKSRNTTDNWNLVDRLRGTSANLYTNSTSAEGAVARLTSFDANGYTFASGYGATNISGQTFVDYAWKAGGAGVSNTDGSITSTVSANVEAGFSIVTYTGNNTSGATVGHGLGAKPAFIVVKKRTGTDGWGIYHASLGATKSLELNATAAAAVTSIPWNNTEPTSSVIYLNGNNYANSSSFTYVMYCFAEIPSYSKFGSYVGNGSADGPFVYCGFKPRWILRKCAGATSNWFLIDTARDTYNASNLRLNADLSDAESAGANSDIDVTATGFKIRAASTAGVNQSGQTHIFMAFADVPGKYALAR